MNNPQTIGRIVLSVFPNAKMMSYHEPAQFKIMATVSREKSTFQSGWIVHDVDPENTLALVVSDYSIARNIISQLVKDISDYGLRLPS